MFNQRMADMMLMKGPEQTCAFYRNGLMFVFNFHFCNSLNNVLIPVHQPGEYTVVLSSDDEKYGGFGNVKMQTYSTKLFDGKHYIELYIPARTCFVLKEKVILPPPAEEPAAAVEAPVEKKTTRKRTTKKVTEEAPATEEKPKRKRTTKKASEEAAPAEEAPKKTTRKRTTKKAAE